MTNTYELDDSFDRLQRNICDGRSVLVLGPGCQRVGFDAGDSTGWRHVQERMRLLGAVLPAETTEQRRFLEGFWRSKLSDEVARNQPDPQSAQNPWLAERLTLFPKSTPVASASATDAVRIHWLAKPILDLFAFGTSRLGAVISEGLTPVINWYDVNDARLRIAAVLHADPGASSAEALGPVTDPIEADSKDELEIPSISTLSEILGRITTATAILAEWRNDPRPGELTHPTLAPIDVAKADVDPLLNFVTASQIRALQHCARSFKRQCVDGPSARLNGANVQWLGDLLWHVITCDAEVPPSQSEIAFHLNLPAGERQAPGAFVRPRPGEYRLAGSQDSQVTRDSLLRSLLRNRTRVNARDGALAAGPLRDLYATLASVLIEQARGKGFPQRPLALVAGYDLVLEEIMLRLLKPGSTMHVVLPVRVRSQTKGEKYDWLIASFESPVTWDDDSLMDAEPTVRWLRHVEKIADGEPVILRVAGAPFLPLVGGTSAGDDGSVLQGDLGLGPRDVVPGAAGHDDDEDDFDDPDNPSISPVLVFAEYEASQVFRALGDAMPKWLEASLGWSDRSWLFLGEGFPEWLPRLRLLYTSSLAGPTVEKHFEHGLPARDLLAVDRAFSWPEASLLAALGVNCFIGDLQRLKLLAGRKLDEDASGRVNEFWVNVKKTRAKLRSAGDQ